MCSDRRQLQRRLIQARAKRGLSSRSQGPPEWCPPIKYDMHIEQQSRRAAAGHCSLRSPGPGDHIAQDADLQL